MTMLERIMALPLAPRTKELLKRCLFDARLHTAVKAYALALRELGEASTPPPPPDLLRLLDVTDLELKALALFVLDSNHAKPAPPAEEEPLG